MNILLTGRSFISVMRVINYEQKAVVILEKQRLLEKKTLTIIKPVVKISPNTSNCI